MFSVLMCSDYYYRWVATQRFQHTGLNCLVFTGDRVPLVLCVKMFDMFVAVEVSLRSGF